MSGDDRHYEFRKPPVVEPPPRLRPPAFTGCRWPVEREGRLEFCGALRVRDIYCAEHASHAEPEVESRPLLMRKQKIGRRSSSV